MDNGWLRYGVVGLSGVDGAGGDDLHSGLCFAAGFVFRLAPPVAVEVFGLAPVAAPDAHCVALGLAVKRTSDRFGNEKVNASPPAVRVTASAPCGGPVGSWSGPASTKW